MNEWQSKSVIDTAAGSYAQVVKRRYIKLQEGRLLDTNLCKAGRASAMTINMYVWEYATQKDISYNSHLHRAGPGIT
jgi:hypothetical protein